MTFCSYILCRALRGNLFRMISSSEANVQRGAFILIEGVDKCGKTTQTRLLAEKLRCLDYRVSERRFPDRQTSTGKLINTYLTSSTELEDRSIHLLFSANRWEAASSIKEDIRCGKIIICDRYAYSGVAFSASKPKMSVEWCKAPDRGLPAPDAIIFLDLTVEVAQRRSEFGQERYENEDFQRKVRDTFLHLKAEEESTGSRKWKTIDASLPVNEVHEELVSVALDVIKEVQIKNRPIEELWV